jgi:hemolysin D
LIGHLEIYATARGKIEVIGRSKVVQPVETGKVLAIRAELGARVHAGDLLFELDAVDALADLSAATENLAASRAEAICRGAAVDMSKTIRVASGSAGLDRMPNVVFDAEIPLAIRTRYLAALEADLKQLQDSLRNLEKQEDLKVSTRRRIEAGIASQTTLLGTLESRVNMRESSIKLDVGTRVALFDALEALQRAQTQLATDRGQLQETERAIEEIASQKQRLISQFIADNQNKRTEAARKADEVAQELIKARAKLDRTKIVSPIDGVVQQLAVTTVGQVVTVGQQLMTVTPVEGALFAQAFISNVDIGFVRPGQPVDVKIDAFPFTRFGAIRGKVEKVATDAIDETEAKRVQANPIASGGVQNPAPGQQEFSFPVTISLERETIDVGDSLVPLSPGMTVSVDIRTGRRRIIEYLLSPLRNLGSRAMTER